jgi:G2/mitotic-specific cyclin 3/4
MSYLISFRTTFDPEVIFLAAHLVDVYMITKRNPPLNHYRAPVDTALILAAKYNGLATPSRNTVQFYNKHYHKNYREKVDHFQREAEFLAVIDYDLSWPGPVPFLDRLKMHCDMRHEAYQRAIIILQESLLQNELAHAKPSMLAAAAYHLVSATHGAYHQVMAL